MDAAYSTNSPAMRRSSYYSKGDDDDEDDRGGRRAAAVARESIVNLLCLLPPAVRPPARPLGLYFHKTFPASSACDRENARARVRT